MTMKSTIVTLASIVVTSHAAVTVLDTPLPFSIYKDGTNCKGATLSSGVIQKVAAMKEEGTFCENTIQYGDNSEDITVYTKVIFSSCDAVSTKGTVDLMAYACKDADCSSCTDLDSIPVPAQLELPKYDPLPAANTCWGVEATSTGVTVLNKFDKGASADGVRDYWNLYTENSCVKDTVKIASEQQSSTSGATISSPWLVATSMAVGTILTILH